MKKYKYSYFLSIGLRGLTLLSKFAFVILMAHLISPIDVGVFGLVSAAIGYAIFAIGFEFYTYASREIISAEKCDIFGILKNQVSFYIFSYLLFSPVLIAIFFYKILPDNTEYWFIALLFFEHISQEINRILITIQKQLLASFILFIRQGLWCWVAILLMLLWPTFRTVETVFILWLLGTIIASFIGIFKIWDETSNDKKSQLDWVWIKKGLYLSTPMLVASLALRGIFTFDRFSIEYISGLEVLGAYTLFISMTSAIQSFLDTILVSFAFPKIAGLAARQEFELYFTEIKKFAIHLICLTSLLCIGCGLCGHLLLAWLNKPEYTNYYSIFYLLILATFIYCVGLIPHMALYTIRKDKPIIISQVASLLLFLVSLVFGLILDNIYVVPIGMILCFLFLTSWKIISFIKIYKELKSRNVHAYQH